MNLTGIWGWLAPLLKPSVDLLVSNVEADSASFFAAINALAVKDEPAVAAVVTKYVDEIPLPGFVGTLFGGDIRSIVVGYATSLLVKLIGEGEALEQPAFDSFLAKLKEEVASVGL